MKEIKVFLASSEELENERKEIADLVLNLNEIYSEKEIAIKLKKWEYLDKAFNAVRKQEEYNQAVRSCDIFLALFYTKAGKFTLEEFDIAIEQYNKSRQTPMILVFLKDLMPTDIEDESLKLFKFRLANDLGYYWARFNHTDKLKLDIILQLQRFDIFGQSGQVYIKDSNIYLADGTMVASLENLPFASNNQQWNQLKKEWPSWREIKRYSTINDLNEDELSDFAGMKKELDDKQKSLQKLEDSMFNTALVIAQSVGTKSSNRLRKAQEYFELGDIGSANLVLDYQEVMNDTDNNKHLYEQEQKILEVRRENLLLNIQELRMKISLLISKKTDDFTEEDSVNTISALDKITEICQIIKMDDSEQWTIVLEILNQLYSSNKFNSEFIVHFAWICIHGLKKDSPSMGYESAYRFIVKCLLIIAQSYKMDTSKNLDTLLRLLSLALEYNKKVYDEDNIERASIYALIGDTYYQKFRETSFRFDEQILYNCSKSKEIREKLLGKNHPDTINIVNNTAFYLHRMFYKKQAVEILEPIINNICATDNEYRQEEGIYIVDTRFNIESVHYIFNTALYYGNYADLLRDNEKFEDAIIWYEKALDIEKSDYDSLCGYMARMGKCLVELGNYKRGIECMQQSLKMATTYSGVEPMTDDDNDFYRYWKYCADSERMSFPLVHMISYAFYKVGNHEDSIKYAMMYLDLNLRAQKWNKSNPDSLLETFDIVEAYHHLGFVYYEAGQYELSIRVLENALQLLKGRNDYMTKAPTVLSLLIDACNSNKETEKGKMFANELEKINTTLEEEPLLYEPSVSTLVFLEKKILPNVTLEAGDYTVLKYGDYEVGKRVSFDTNMQDEGLKDLIILQNKRICKYHTSLMHCGFTLNTSIVEVDSVNMLINGLNRFLANKDDGPLFNPFVYSIVIKDPQNTACGNVIPSGVYPLYKYGAFEVGKFQQFDTYIREYDLPQITVIQIGNELHGFWACLKGYEKSLVQTSRNTNVVKEHVDRLQKFLGENYVPDEITDRVLPEIKAWKSRMLDSVYPIVWMDAIHYKVTDERGCAVTRAIYNVLGIDRDGHKELLGMYISRNEGANFWLSVLTDLQNRGVEDILIACIDGLKGFPEAIQSVYPNTAVQLCVVHQIRNSIKYVGSKNQKEFLKDLKCVYQAVNKESAENELLKLEEKWGEQYPIVIRSWQDNWDKLSEYFQYTPAIRKLIYTTNTVEGYHRQIRKVTKNKGVFPSDTALEKLVYLAYRNIRKKWTMPLANWATISQQLAIKFGERFKLL